MPTGRHISGVLLAATLVASACGGGDDGDSTAALETTEAPAPVEVGDTASSATLSLVEIVWALDGERVDPDFDYTEPIARDRYDAGLRLDAIFETTGDMGTITTDLRLPVTINGDDIRAGSIIGPERSPTRPDFEDITIVDTADGFIAQVLIGRPLSPISLVDTRERAVEFGLDPDDEVIDIGEVNDNQLTFDAAGLNDIPNAPVNGRNEFFIAMTGTVEFGNGFVLDVGERVERLDISETPSVAIAIGGDCPALTERYLTILAEELAAPDVVLLDRLRAYEQIIDITRENDCGPRDFAIPVCDAATAATAPETLLERHLAICPDEREAVEALVFEPRFEDGVVRLVVPSTVDGLPAYNVAISWPDWTVETTSEGMNRQKIALSADPETVGRFTRLDIDVSAMPAGLLEERAAAAVEPEQPDADILIADTTTVGGLPARRLVAQVEPDPAAYQVGTAIEIDAERLLTITGVVATTAELPVDGDGIAALMACIESSMVVVEYDPDVEPAPAADCTSITELSFSASAPDAAAQPSASVDGSTLTLNVPGVGDGPFHVVTVSTPEWRRSDLQETDLKQVVKVDDEGQGATFVRVTAELTEDYAASAEEAAAPFSDEWTIVTDSIRTLGNREIRVVEKLWDSTGIRKGEIITQINDDRILLIEVNIDGRDDFDAIFATALDSLTITP